MFNAFEGDVVHLLEAPFLVAIFHQGEYSLLIRGNTTRVILCKNPTCEHISKSCVHCQIYQGDYLLAVPFVRWLTYVNTHSPTTCD